MSNKALDEEQQPCDDMPCRHKELKGSEKKEHALVEVRD